MTQQYGFRAALNLAEIVDNDKCLDNLGIYRPDLALLEGTSAAGVTEKDYQAIIGLKANLEQQIIATTSGVNAVPATLSGKASRLGDTFRGSVIAQSVNNDRPYYDAAYSIYGPSTASYFSPANASGFSTGAQYKLGPVYAATATISGLNFAGSVKTWDNYYVRYKQYARIIQNSTSALSYVPLFLAPPSSFSSNKVWLDAEYSTFVADTNGVVEQWQDVLGRASAVQTTVANRPVLTSNLRYDKPGVVFDGTNDFLTLGDLGGLFPTAATAVIVATVGTSGTTGDTDYNIFGTLNSTSNRWRATTASGAFGVFTSTVQTGFPAPMPSTGTYVFTVTASNASGLQLRTNSTVTATKTNSPVVQVVYAGGTAYTIGANSNGSAGFLNGTIYAIALFDQVLTGKELRSIEEYFAWRFDFVFDPDRTQSIELENSQLFETEGGVTFILG
jgi:hypothetical protein